MSSKDKGDEDKKKFETTMEGEEKEEEKEELQSDNRPSSADSEKDSAPHKEEEADAENDQSSNKNKDSLKPFSRQRKRRNVLDDEDSEDDSDSANDDDDDDDDAKDMEAGVSLNDLKRKVLGRDLEEEGDDEDEELQQVKALMNPTTARGSQEQLLADKLRRDLTCNICHEIVYPPVSLLCGHSFCQNCILWWLDQAASCPTCRQDVPADAGRTLLSTNLALRACVIAVYGHDIVRRIKANKQQMKGENEGKHEQGYQVLSDLGEDSWKTIQIEGSSDDEDVLSTVKARRSRVLDAEDQRMQLALSLYEQPERTWVEEDESPALRIRLCLLSMEEDEVESDGGFPICIMTSEDERLICSSHNGSRFEFCQLGVQRKGKDGTLSPLARVNCNANGIFDFVVNLAEENEQEYPGRALLFVHSETGTQLEVSLAQKDSSTKNEDGDCDRNEVISRKKRKPKSMVLDDEDSDEEDEDDEKLNQFEEDGFLVGEGEEEEEEGSKDQEGEFSDEEGAFSNAGDDNDDDTHEECAICNDGGDLMMCDGGTELEGCCGRAFHASCVGRSSVPEGDWVCQDCARKLGGLADTGPEGHEFPATNQSEQDSDAPKSKRSRLALVDSDDEGNDEDDDDDEKEELEDERVEKSGGAAGKKGRGEDTGPPDNNKRRRVIVDSDSE